MDGTRIAALDELATDDTAIVRVRPVDGDGEVASGAAALASDEATAAGSNAIDGDGSETDDASAETAVREAVLLRLADEDGEPSDDVACFLNYCQHMTHIKLDKGSGAPVRGGELVCANHGAMFAADTGRCTYGPCEGAFLNGLAVTVDDGGVYLTDDEYEYVGDGPVDDDDDLSSSSNVVL